MAVTRISYFAQANDAFTCGDVQLAKATTLEAVQHVTAESPRLHLLLGKIALSLGDKNLSREVKTFLEFLQADHFLKELLAAENSRGSKLIEENSPSASR